MIVRSFKLPKQIHGGVCLPCTVETCGKSLKKKKKFRDSMAIFLLVEIHSYDFLWIGAIRVDF